MVFSDHPTIAWSVFPYQSTLWGIQTVTKRVTMAQWHALGPGWRALYTDRDLCITLHFEQTALPSWDTLCARFPSARDWITPDHWNWFVAKWHAAETQQPIPLWLPDSS